jgi:hypothetical protein
MNYNNGRRVRHYFYWKLLLCQFYFLKITGADLNFQVNFSITEHWAERCANLHATAALPRRKNC